MHQIKILRERFEKSTEVETLIAIARESIEALEKSEDTVKLLRGIIQKYENVLYRNALSRSMKRGE